jgi:hypothetical protein
MKDIAIECRVSKHAGCEIPQVFFAPETFWMWQGVHIYMFRIYFSNRRFNSAI